jgi:ABC-type glycerol-3-phosphate transport system permease component
MTANQNAAAAGAKMAMNRKFCASEITFHILNYTILILFMLVCLYPFYYIFIYSISDPTRATVGITLFPRGFSLFSYEKIFKIYGIFNSTVISVLRTVIGTAITTFCCSLFAYLVTIEKLPMRKAVYRFLIVTMYFNAGLIPWYLLMKFLALNNNFLLYIIPSAMNAFYIILIKTYIEQLPKSMEESAKLDGAGYFMIYCRIIFPLSMAVIATIIVFAAVGQWNSWMDNYFLVTNPNLNVLQYLLYQYLANASSLATQSIQDYNNGLAAKLLTPMTIKMTITMVVTLPILFVYPIAQRYFVKGIMLGAIKG